MINEHTYGASTTEDAAYMRGEFHLQPTRPKRPHLERTCFAYHLQLIALMSSLVDKSIEAFWAEYFLYFRPYINAKMIVLNAAILVVSIANGNFLQYRIIFHFNVWRCVRPSKKDNNTNFISFYNFTFTNQ